MKTQTLNDYYEKILNSEEANTFLSTEETAKFHEELKKRVNME